MRRIILVIAILTFNNLIILSQAGKLDLYFGRLGIAFPGKGLFEGRMTGYNSLALQSDGKFLLTGTIYNPANYDDLIIIRCNENGSLDADFYYKGYISLDIENQNNVGKSIALQKDNKIVVSSTVGNKFAILRFNADGSQDQSFGYNGCKVFDITGENYAGDNTCSIAIQQDQKIVVFGSSGNGYVSDFYVMRLNSDGSLDNQFGESGITMLDFKGGIDLASDMVIQPDGKIVLAGYTNALIGIPYSFIVSRILTDGSLDTSFNKIGYAITPIGDDHNDAYCYSVGIQDDGKILTVGTSSLGFTIMDNVLIRYNANGSIDSSFGNNGIVINDLGTIDSWSTDMAFQPDKKIVVSGFYRELYDQNIIIYRYNSDGSLDLSFANGGYSNLDLGAYDDAAMSTVLGSNRLLVAGNSGGNFVALRYRLDYQTGSENNMNVNYNFLVHPNPVGSEMILEYNLNDSKTISMALFDLNGKVAQILINNLYRSAGDHTETVKMNRSIIPGMYLLKIWSSDFIITQKVFKVDQ
jgi:uncharacterized delta-60 repeat protein